MLWITGTPTDLRQGLTRRDWLRVGLAGGAGSICAGVFGLGLLRGSALLHSLEVAVSLGVAAIPEGLTALATSVLALASGRMRRKGTLIRTLSAAESLGSVTHVCADKTGTLTENRMAVHELHVEAMVLEQASRARDLVGHAAQELAAIAELDRLALRFGGDGSRRGDQAGNHRRALQHGAARNLEGRHACRGLVTATHSAARALRSEQG